MASPVHRRGWHGEILVAAADDQTGNFLVSGWVPQSILRFERLDALSDLGEIFLRERNIAGLCVGDGLLGLVAAADDVHEVALTAQERDRQIDEAAIVLLADVLKARNEVDRVRHLLGLPPRLAFACIALAAVARKLPDSWGWLAGIALGGVGRFVCHVLSGVVFFAEYAEGTGMSPLVYSVSYNSFVFVDLAICAVVMAFPQVRRALKKMTER